MVVFLEVLVGETFGRFGILGRKIAVMIVRINFKLVFDITFKKLVPGSVDFPYQGHV